MSRRGEYFRGEPKKVKSRIPREVEPKPPKPRQRTKGRSGAPSDDSSPHPPDIDIREKKTTTLVTRTDHGPVTVIELELSVGSVTFRGEEYPSNFVFTIPEWEPLSSNQKVGYAAGANGIQTGILYWRGSNLDGTVLCRGTNGAGLIHLDSR